MKGMILTAGLGTRLKPLTDKTPKALVKVGEFSMLDMAIMYLKKHGVDELIINVHHYADQLMEYVAEKRWQGFKIDISNETDKLLNTGGGLLKAAPFFNNSPHFVLMAVDVLTDLNLTDMIAQHENTQALVTLGVKERATSRSLLFNNQGELAGWRHNQTGEVKSISGKTGNNGYGFSGIHVISSKIFDLITETWEFSIIDLYLRLAETQKIMAFNHSGGTWMEFGRTENIEKAKNDPNFVRLIENLKS